MTTSLFMTHVEVGKQSRMKGNFRFKSGTCIGAPGCKGKDLFVKNNVARRVDPPCGEVKAYVPIMESTVS
jgi:hypothetical protein